MFKKMKQCYTPFLYLNILAKRVMSYVKEEQKLSSKGVTLRVKLWLQPKIQNDGKGCAVRVNRFLVAPRVVVHRLLHHNRRSIFVETTSTRTA